MTREEALQLIEEDVKDWVLGYPFSPDTDGQVSEKISEEFEVGNGITADVQLNVSGRIWYSRGDRFSPPESGGSVGWSSTEIHFYNEDGEEVLEGSLYGEIQGDEEIY